KLYCGREASGVRLRILGCVRNDLADLDTGRAGCRAGDFRRVTTRREQWVDCLSKRIGYSLAYFLHRSNALGTPRCGSSLSVFFSPSLLGRSMSAITDGPLPVT